MPSTLSKSISVPKEDVYNWINFRIPHHHKDLPFILCWSHKSGCTSTLKWFFWHTGDLDKALSYTEKAGLVIHNYEAKVFKSGSDYRTNLVDAILQGKPIINFLRCPYERAFSSYMHLHNKHFIRLEKDQIYNVGLEVRREVQRFVYGEDVSIEYPFSFWQYLKYLHSMKPSELEKHHSPQYTPIFDIKTVTHYRLEDLNKAFDELEKKFDLQESKEARHRFMSAHHIQKQSVKRRTTLKLLNLGIPLDPSPRFVIPVVNRNHLANTRFGELIEQVFRKDIEIYDTLARTIRS